MDCCQCQGIEDLFSRQYVKKELARYRVKGPDRTTRMLIKALKEAGIAGMTLLDIGSGLGAVQHELVRGGVREAVSVEASRAYLTAAKEEARRRGLAERITYRHGDFVDLAGEIMPVDIVTLDRVICCYHDMEQLVSLSAERARKLYGVVYPRDSWWVRLLLAAENLFFRLRGRRFRTYAHASEAVEAVVKNSGLKKRSYHQTLVWQVVVYTR